MHPLLRTALDAADAAALVHTRWAGRMEVAGADSKGKADFVSRADHEAQDAALAVIREARPDHRILAEEEDDPDTAAALRGGTPIWVVDPLDGTTNFLHGHPMSAASVAVAVDGRVEAGAVACAATGERWWAARGEGAWKNGLPLRVSGVRDPERALVGTGFPFKKPDLVERYLAQLGRVLRGTGGVRRGGAAALDLCYLAEGRFDAFWELFLNPWDFAAGILVIEEAGGIVTADGSAPRTLEPGAVVAANGPELLETLVGLLDPATG